MGDEIMRCEFCLMRYVPSASGDTQAHKAYHQKCVDSYHQTLMRHRGEEITWFRPEDENAGVYRALNELNPRFRGFSFTGLAEDAKKAFRNGHGVLTEGDSSGDGHDRFGNWEWDIGGKTYQYHANWRCGRVHFVLQ